MILKNLKERYFYNAGRVCVYFENVKSIRGRFRSNKSIDARALLRPAPCEREEKPETASQRNGDERGKGSSKEEKLFFWMQRAASSLTANGGRARSPVARSPHTCRSAVSHSLIIPQPDLSKDTARSPLFFFFLSFSLGSTIRESS